MKQITSYVNATLASGGLDQSKMPGNVGSRPAKHFWRELSLISFQAGQFYELVTVRMYCTPSYKRTVCLWVNTPDTCLIGERHVHGMVSSSGADMWDLSERLLDACGLTFQHSATGAPCLPSTGQAALQDCLLAFGVLLGFQHLAVLQAGEG